MPTLILPIGGKSSRFNGGKPKWAERHPAGGIMLDNAIAGIYHRFNRIIVIMLDEHRQYTRTVKASILKRVGDIPVAVVFIDSSTSQPMTVAKGILEYERQYGDLQGSFLVKDCDNYYTIDEDALPTEDFYQGNCVVYARLEDYPSVIAANKSYIQHDFGGRVLNIVEKRVISNTFCVGGYGFQSAKTFLETYSSRFPEKQEGELYLSHVIYADMMYNGARYGAVHCKDFIDWGTQKDWDTYVRSFATLFIDIDGVLVHTNPVESTGEFNDSPPMPQNIEFLKGLCRERTFIVLVTARPEKYRERTIDQMQEMGIPWDQLVMGLPHSRRVLINDVLSKESELAALSINPLRNCDGELSETWK